MRRYKTLTDEEGIELKSQEMFRFACCDCGLVHDMVLATGKKGEPIGLAVRRNKRATAYRRKKQEKRLQAAAEIVRRGNEYVDGWVLLDESGPIRLGKSAS